MLWRAHVSCFLPRTGCLCQVRYQQLLDTIADLEGQIKSMEKDLVLSMSQVSHTLAFGPLHAKASPSFLSFSSKYRNR